MINLGKVSLVPAPRLSGELSSQTSRILRWEMVVMWCQKHLIALCQHCVFFLKWVVSGPSMALETAFNLDTFKHSGYRFASC